MYNYTLPPTITTVSGSRLWNPHDNEWVDDAAKGSVGGIWNFLVDGLVSPSGLELSIISGTVHAARIDASGDLFIDVERTGGVNVDVHFNFYLDGIRKPLLWPNLCVSLEVDLVESSGTLTGELDLISFIDEDDPGAFDILTFDQIIPGGQYRIVRRLDDDAVGNATNGSINNPRGVSQEVVLFARPGLISGKSNIGSATGKSLGKVVYDPGGAVRRWFGRADFNEISDRFRGQTGILLHSVNSRGVVTIKSFELNVFDSNE